MRRVGEVGLSEGLLNVGVGKVPCPFGLPVIAGFVKAPARLTMLRISPVSMAGGE